MAERRKSLKKLEQIVISAFPRKATSVNQEKNITRDCKGCQLVTQRGDLSHYGKSSHKSNALLGIAQIRWLTHFVAGDLELDGSI